MMAFTLAGAMGRSGEDDDLHRRPHRLPHHLPRPARLVPIDPRCVWSSGPNQTRHVLSQTQLLSL